jgi:DNA modification methylase
VRACLNATVPVGGLFGGTIRPMPKSRPAPASVTLSWPGKCVEPVPRDVTLIESERFGGESANRLIDGDNLDALAALSGLSGQVAFIYIDPPYAMEKDHSVEVDAGEHALNAAAFSDTWGADGASYLQFMYQRLPRMRELLSDDGVLCVHCDWRANSWLRVLLDEVFGRRCFRNEIIWRRAPNLGRQAASRQLGRVTDSLLVYSRTEGAGFRGVAPRLSAPLAVTSSGRPKGAKWDEEAKAWFTTAPRGDYTDASIEALRAQGRVHETASGRVYIKYQLRQGVDGRWYKDQPADTLWTDAEVRPLRHCSKEELAIGYATQKPEGLLRRLIEWTTREGDLVADFFCGSGTTLAAAERLGRRWIGCDLGRVAIHTSRKRMLGLGARFSVWRTEPRDAAGIGELRASVAPDGAVTIDELKLRSTLPDGAHWRDWIDAWAVGDRAGDGVFVPEWTARRTTRGGIKLTSPPLGGVCGAEPARRLEVRVWDVLGGEAAGEAAREA